MVPDRHVATAWKHWIFCLTDHLDSENLENRRRYHNPGKPRTAGLCGREVVASDHLPLSSTFFGRPKTPDLTLKTAALVPPPMLFSSGDTLAKLSRHLRPHRPTRPAASSASPVLLPPPKPHTTPHRRQRAAVVLEVLTLDPRCFTPFYESLLLFFTAAQFLLVPPLKNLTKPASLSCPESPDSAFKPISSVPPTQAKISRYFVFLVSVHFYYNIQFFPFVRPC